MATPAMQAEQAKEMARQRAAVRSAKAKTLCVEWPIVFSRALSPFWASACVPTRIKAIYPTPASATIAMPGSAFTRLDARYLARRAEVGSSFVRLPDGRLLSYFVDGKASGVPVLLLHGNGSNKYRWVQKVPLKGVRLIAIDRPGYGDSTPAPLGYTADDFVLNMVALLDALAVGKVIVLGHSMGCLWGSILAGALPTRVVSLVLCSPTLRPAGPLPPAILPFLKESTAPVARANQIENVAARAANKFDSATNEQKATPKRYAAFAADPFWVSVQYESFRCFRDERHFLMATISDSMMTQSAQAGQRAHPSEGPACRSPRPTAAPCPARRLCGGLKCSVQALPSLYPKLLPKTLPDHSFGSSLSTRRRYAARSTSTRASATRSPSPPTRPRSRRGCRTPKSSICPAPPTSSPSAPLSSFPSSSAAPSGRRSATYSGPSACRPRDPPRDPRRTLWVAHFAGSVALCAATTLRWHAESVRVHRTSSQSDAIEWYVTKLYRTLGRARGARGHRSAMHGGLAGGCRTWMRCTRIPRMKEAKAQTSMRVNRKRCNVYKSNTDSRCVAITLFGMYIN